MTEARRSRSSQTKLGKLQACQKKKPIAALCKLHNIIAALLSAHVSFHPV
jgi:hypothetical protein